MGKSTKLLLTCMLAASAAVLFYLLNQETQEQPGPDIIAIPGTPEPDRKVYNSDTVIEAPPAGLAVAVEESQDTGSEPFELKLDTIGDIDEILVKMDMNGIEEMLELNRNWMHQRGYPKRAADRTLLLDQPYEQFDDYTLRLYAENGDMWAMQLLADRIGSERPAEAIALYESAARHGSLYAMQKIERLYRTAGKLQPGDNADPAGVDDSLPPGQLGTAWAVVAQMAGANPEANGNITSRMGETYNEAELDTICRSAEEIYTRLQSNSVRGGFDRSAPPMSTGNMEALAAVPCADKFTLPTGTFGPDFSSCKEFGRSSDSPATTVIACRKQ